jgi:hypothetical protein
MPVSIQRFKSSVMLFQMNYKLFVPLWAYRIACLLAIALISVFEPAFSQNERHKKSFNDLSKSFGEDVVKREKLFNNRVTNKTEKTLERLAHWERKIRLVLAKTNPTLNADLFAPGKITFEALHDMYKRSETVLHSKLSSYDPLIDKVSTGIAYVNRKVLITDSVSKLKVLEADSAMTRLSNSLAVHEQLKTLIKQRRAELSSKALSVLLNKKYLGKIGEEAYYYGQAIENYKDLLSDETVAQHAMIKALRFFPGFEKFRRNNSMLAQLFGAPDAPVNPTVLNGLQTRESINQTVLAVVNSTASGSPPLTSEVFFCTKP